MQSSLPYRLGTTPFLISEVEGCTVLEPLMFIDFRGANGSHTTEGAGVAHPPFCPGTHRFEHQLHAASANGEASHDHAR